MREYYDINKVFRDLISSADIVKAGNWQGTDTYKDMNMRVLRNIILKPKIVNLNREKARDYSLADQPWSELHFLERINGIPSNPGTSYKFWPYANFDKDNDPYLKGKIFSHTYQERFWPRYAGMVPSIGEKYPDTMREGIRFEYGDLNSVIETIKNNKLTRQAYLPIWFPEDTWAANNNDRVPCTLGYYFYIQDNQLHMNYTIRSCDAFRHFRNDIYLTQRLLIYVAKRVEAEVGCLTMIIYNLHLFENDNYAFTKKEFRNRNER